MPGEFITISVGGAGCSLGHEVWRQYNAENDLQNGGEPGKKTHISYPLRNYYHETKRKKFIPRHISVKISIYSIFKKTLFFIFVT